MEQELKEFIVATLQELEDERLHGVAMVAAKKVVWRLGIDATKPKGTAALKDVRDIFLWFAAQVTAESPAMAESDE